MKRGVAALAALGLLFSGPARAEGISVAVNARFVRSASAETTWSAVYTDEDGNPVDELHWTRLCLTATLTNASSEDIDVRWALEDEAPGVQADAAARPDGGEPDALDTAYPVAVGATRTFVIALRRDAETALPEDGLHMIYVISPAEEETP